MQGTLVSIILHRSLEKHLLVNIGIIIFLKIFVVYAGQCIRLNKSYIKDYIYLFIIAIILA